MLEPQTSQTLACQSIHLLNQSVLPSAHNPCCKQSANIYIVLSIQATTGTPVLDYLCIALELTYVSKSTPHSTQLKACSPPYKYTAQLIISCLNTTIKAKHQPEITESETLILVETIINLINASVPDQSGKGTSIKDSLRVSNALLFGILHIYTIIFYIIY